MSLLKHRIYLNVSDAEHSYATDHKEKNKKKHCRKKVSVLVSFSKKNPKDWQDCANTGNLVWCTDVI